MVRIGAFQFKPQEDCLLNHEKIIQAIKEAAAKQVRLLVFQECATCGYPPVEIPAVTMIDFALLERQLQEIRGLARTHHMFIALGTIRKVGEDYYNSIEVINDQGELLESYDKRALWGWDTENFKRGRALGIYDIDGVKVGFRICFEVRFPEYFRELFEANVQLGFVSFCDVCPEKNETRYNLIKAHLMTRQ